MPIGKYFKGHGEEVMAAMKKEYGGKKGESVFYATSNKMKNGMAAHLNTMKASGTLKSKKIKPKG